MIYALIGIAAAFCACIQWCDEIPMPHGDVNKKESKYEFKVAKQEEKEKYKRKKLEKTPSGYMTVEEYNILSAPKDRMTMEVEIPKHVTPADMVYVTSPEVLK